MKGLTPVGNVLPLTSRRDSDPSPMIRVVANRDCFHFEVGKGRDIRSVDTGVDNEDRQAG